MHWHSHYLQRSRRDILTSTPLFLLSLWNLLPSALPLQQGADELKLSALLTTQLFSLIASSFPRDYRNERWVGSIGTLHSWFLSPHSSYSFLFLLSHFLSSFSFSVNSPGHQLCRGENPVCSYTHPAALNCSKKIHIMSSHTKGTLITLTSSVVEWIWEQWKWWASWCKCRPLLTPFRNKN